MNTYTHTRIHIHIRIRTYIYAQMHTYAKVPKHAVQISIHVMAIPVCKPVISGALLCR